MKEVISHLPGARPPRMLGALGIPVPVSYCEGVSLVVTRIEVDFQGDLCAAVTSLRFLPVPCSVWGACACSFWNIYRVSDQRWMLGAVVTGTALNARGRPEIPHQIRGSGLPALPQASPA